MKKLKSEINRPWGTHYKEIGTTPNVLFPDYAAIDLFKKSVDKHSDLVAIEYYKETLSYKGLYDKIIIAAKALKAMGVKETDKVTICMPNMPQAIILFYAVNMIGAVSVMLHPLSAEKEIEDYLLQTKSNYMLILDMLYKKIENIIDKDIITKVIVTGSGDEVSLMKSIAIKLATITKVPFISNSKVIRWKNFMNLALSFNDEYECERKGEDLAVILFSGGTSGIPKGVMLSNLNLNSEAMLAREMIKMPNEGDSILGILPLFHALGLGVGVHAVAHFGMKNILIPTFKANKFDELIKKHQPNFIMGVPTLFQALLNTSNYKADDLKCIKCVVCGGDYLNYALKRKIEKFFKVYGSDVPVIIGYGLTECSGAVSVTVTEEYRNDSIGTPFPNTDFKIVRIGTHDEALPGENGEICISGPTVMMGYLENPEETAQAIRRHDDNQLWLHTGDLGSIDEDGYVYYSQRLKRLIISSGYNVYPSQIEEVINKFTGVVTSTVIGIAHPYKVQVPKAFVVLHEGIEPTKDFVKELKLYCKKNLMALSVPYEFEFKDSLPKTKIGKVAYRDLIDEENKKEP